VHIETNLKQSNKLLIVQTPSVLDDTVADTQNIRNRYETNVSRHNIYIYIYIYIYIVDLLIYNIICT